MNRELLKVSFRNNAIVIPKSWIVDKDLMNVNQPTIMLVIKCARLGYTFSESLLRQINRLSAEAKHEIFDFFEEVTGVKKNWTPLIKQWNIPTDETRLDHIITYFINLYGSREGTRLACGHLIPNGSFPIERYNGCPFCGTPFEFDKINYDHEIQKLKVLELWTEEELQDYLKNLLTSPVALDATQVDDLNILLSNCELPQKVEVTMRETLMLVIDTLVENNQAEKANQLFKTPNDILRYLWYKHTGFLQIIEPKTIIARLERNGRNWHRSLATNRKDKVKAIKNLKLKFSRAECRQYAQWLNSLDMKIETQCEIMHPKRGIWVRVIRALRLAEYSKKKGFERLAKLLDVFYREDYDVWTGRLNEYRLQADSERAFRLLKQRPGFFARSLFSSMMWLGPDDAIKHFTEVIDQVPARLVFTLNMYADYYFNKDISRVVKPLGGVNKRIPANMMVRYYPDEELERLRLLVASLSLEVMKKRFMAEENVHSTIFIDESLHLLPISIGDRSKQVQELATVAMGTRFKVEGDKVRLFMQWGGGLSAQHLDMDLSCVVAYGWQQDICSYRQLRVLGCQHSGDIQRIPHLTGTAEYIDIDINAIASKGARYVSFTCNAYTSGNLAPNLVVGWMNSDYPMSISSNGVAYNPAHVQHQVRVTNSLNKGMVFGVLDVQRREIIWLEMGFNGQIAQNMSIKTVEGFINKLESKLKIGDLLKLKAEVQGLEIVDDPEMADEVYDESWGRNTARVSNFLLG